MKLFEDFSRVFVSFSGGKDSVASYIKVAEKFTSDKITLIFTDTGHEMPETYKYLFWFDINVHSVIRLATRVTGKRENGNRIKENIILPWTVSIKDFSKIGIVTIFDEIRLRNKANPDVPMWPGNGIRYCTSRLKIDPFYKFVNKTIEKVGRNKVLIVKGLRQEESSSRKDTEEFVVDEVGTNLYQVWHPVYNLTTEQVFDLHRTNGIPINPVYNIRERSNCVGCPFARNEEIKRTLEVYPNILDEYIAIEEETGYTWKSKYSLKDIKNAVDDLPKEELSCKSGYCDI